MAEVQNFRSAFNGFNREDVVHYLEYINAKHTAQINQLTAENQQLCAQLEAQPEEDYVGRVIELEAECAELTEKLAAAEARCAELEQQKESAQAVSSQELDGFRRAERTEREARERAELVYYQANGVLSEATRKVDGITAEITEMADQVMSQLTQLQMLVGSSKHALQDAASMMHTIRPNQ